ncbi:MAG: hypothetical protein ABL993_11165 [Vicinamibacterales bacterium]
MSRVTYTDTATTADQEAVRLAHRVRIVADAEEGTGVNSLPNGVYGFTYSPALPNAPLFAVRRYRSYETHKLANGEILVVGFATREIAATLSTSAEETTIQIQPEPEGGADVLVMISYGRMRHHRQYAAPNEHGFTVTVSPGGG